MKVAIDYLKHIHIIKDLFSTIDEEFKEIYSTLEESDIESKVKQALANVYNSTSTSKERSALTFMIITLDQNTINQALVEKMRTMSPEELTKFQNNSGINLQQFLLYYINYKPKPITYEDVKTHIENLIKYNADSESSTFSNLIEKFAKRFDEEYEKIQEISKNSTSKEKILASIFEYKQAS